MANTTIEDVLKKHRVFTAGKEALERVTAAMTEYASLNRQGWVKVEDGLPENRPGWSHSESVNIFNGDVNIVSTGAYNYLTKEWDDHLYGSRKFKVTHWMPLPTKPNL